MTKKLTFILIITAATALHVFGQPTDADKRQQQQINQDRRIEAERQKIEERSRQRSEDFIESVNRSISMAASQNAPFKLLSKKDKKEILKNLAPNEEDLAKYKSFLKKSNTGIFRLMPNYGCQEEMVVSVNDKCEKSFFMGEYYSFIRDDYSDKTFFDLTFKDGELLSRNFWLQSIMTSLGDVPLENLTPDSSGVKYLFDFVPQKKSKAVKEQFQEISKGVAEGGYQYSKSAKALVNNTYALRLIGYKLERHIDYRFRDFLPTSMDEKIMLASGMRNGTDIIVAFRIVRQDADGSLTVLWRRLGKQKTPRITFEKKEPLSDFGTEK